MRQSATTLRVRARAWMVDHDLQRLRGRGETRCGLNLVGAGVPEVVAMTVTGHADRAVFQRYNVRRDDVQADALERQEMYLTQRRGTTPTTVTPLRRPGPIRGTTDHATRNPINSTTAKALSRRRLGAMTSRTRKWRNWQTRRIQDPVG